MSMVRIVDVPDRDVRLEVHVEGDRPQVVMVPSANRDASEFARLAKDLHAAGFDSVGVNLRTIGRSTGPTDGLTLRDLADDISDVIRYFVGRPAHLVGHAFGNTVVRATAAYSPESVASVSLLACGGHDTAGDPPSEEWLRHFRRCQQMDLPDEERIESLQIAFFAPGKDPRPWLTGWWPDLLDHASILKRTDPSEWWQGGCAPMLIMQPLNDTLCPPRVGQDLAAALDGRARYVEFANCGHAILPEQPSAVSEHLIRFLQDIAGQDRDRSLKMR